MRVAWLFLLILIFMAVTVMAQEPNPVIDNWCDADGIWDDGRCGQGSIDEQTWHWMCGWYMAQVDNAVFTIDELRVNVPACESLYPPKIERQTNTSPTANCNNPNDTDCDGLLDAWELARFSYLGQSGTDDPDMDGCDNLCEQNLGTTPALDTDNDALPDVSETDFFLTDPNNPDTDGDNLTDGNEVRNIGTNPLLQDTDGDGFNDDVDVCPLVFAAPTGNGC